MTLFNEETFSLKSGLQKGPRPYYLLLLQCKSARSLFVITLVQSSFNVTELLRIMAELSSEKVRCIIIKTNDCKLSRIKLPTPLQT